jgi:pimeloyl-ACP methyl ester carboxylesterase
VTDLIDDDLQRFAAEGASLPEPANEGSVEHDGARIRYATFGAGDPVVLLHGGLGHGGNWSYQVPALVASGYRAIVIDSRGHGRSTRDARPYSYELMGSDVLAVMDALNIERAHIVGWSDGAIVAMILAMQAPERIAGVFFFGANMDLSGTKNFEFNPDSALGRCFARHAKDYERLSSTPGDFLAFSQAVDAMMATQPNAGAAELSRVSVPVAIVIAERDEFIKREHAEYLARTIPNAELHILPGVSHFAPLQRPALFNQTMLAFLSGRG